jgi:hypothetical protein
VRFDGLEPGVRYAYRVGCEEHWSEWNLFRTAGADSEAFSFFYLGDVQNDIRSEVAPLLRAMYADAPQSRFIVFAGDLVNRGMEDANWAEFFEAFGPIVRMTPLIAAPGNHDTNKEMLDDRGNRRVDPSIWLISPFPRTGRTQNISKRPPIRWTINAYASLFSIPTPITTSARFAGSSRCWPLHASHGPSSCFIIRSIQPAASATTKSCAPRWRRCLKNTAWIWCCKVTTIITAAREKSYRSESSPLMPPRRVYAVSISGPKMYKQNKTFTHLMRRMIGETQLYQILTLSPQHLTYVCKSLDGEVKDGFTLLKQAQGTVLVKNRCHQSDVTARSDEGWRSYLVLAKKEFFRLGENIL